MGFVSKLLFEKFPSWDNASKIAFVLGLIMLVAVATLTFLLPEADRWVGFIAFIAVVIALQAVFMWANRDMITTFAQAQNHYLAGEYEQTRDTLLTLFENEEPTAKSLTLLGNTYRQLGDLEQSEHTLKQAMELLPDYHLSFYAMARTMMFAGRYAEAAHYFEQALINAAPDFVQIDFAEALFRRQAPEQDVITKLNECLPLARAEAHQELIVTYMLWRLTDESPPSERLIELGLPYWQTIAQDYSRLPYGQAVSDDIAHLARIASNTNS